MGERINFNLSKSFGLILLVLGLSLTGFGITGKAAGDYTMSDYCKTNMDCVNGKICCINNEIGFCMTNEMCTQLKGTPAISIETPLKSNYSSYTEIGSILIIIAVIFLFIIYKYERKETSSKNKKKSRIK